MCSCQHKFCVLNTFHSNHEASPLADKQANANQHEQYTCTPFCFVWWNIYFFYPPFTTKFLFQEKLWSLNISLVMSNFIKCEPSMIWNSKFECLFWGKNWNSASLKTLFCPKKVFLAIIVVKKLYKTEELLMMQFYLFLFVRISNSIKKAIFCDFQNWLISMEYLLLWCSFLNKILIPWEAMVF